MSLPGRIPRRATAPALALVLLKLFTGSPAFASGAVAPGALRADRDTIYVLPVQRVVEARARPDDPALRAAAGFARSYDVSASHGRLRTTSDMLAGGVGVHVRRFGGLGSFGAVSIRGSASSQVAFYLDGVPLNQAQYGVVNAADLPIEALGRVDVYRGGAPLEFDAPGGGVVELVTRDDGRLWARAAVGAGSFDTRKTDGAFGATQGATRLTVVGQYLESAGDFAYRDDNGTNVEPGDDVDAVRLNNAFTSRAWTGRLATAAGPVALSLTHDRLDKTQGVPGTGSNTALYANLATGRSVTGLRLDPRTPGVVAPSLLLYAVRNRDRFADPQREITGGRVATDDHTTRDGARLMTRVALRAANAFELAAEARRERYEPGTEIPVPSAGPTRTREYVTFGAEDRWSPLDGRVGLTAQVRSEATFDAFPAGSPYPGALPRPAVSRTNRFTRGTLGARTEVARGAFGTLALRVTASRLGRMPSLEELFGHRGGVHGNPDAKPEELTTHDAGLVLDLSGAGTGAAPRWTELQVVAYRTDARDLLVWMQNSAQVSVAQNIGAARLEGVEVAARAAWTWGLSADLSYTRQWTRDESDVAYWQGNELPGRPGHEASLRLAHVARHAPVRPFAELHVVGAHYLDRANLQPVAARALIDLGATLLAPGSAPLELTLECTNLTDRRAYDFGGYPLPGRSLFAGLRYRFDGKDESL